MNKISKDNLHEFIHTLTPTEKRFFKRYLASRKEESNDYLHLFDVFNEMKIYDKEHLKNRTSKFNFHKNIEVKKHYLLEVLLESMRQYRDKKNELFNSLLEIDILIEKGLYNFAHKRLKASKKVRGVSPAAILVSSIISKRKLSEIFSPSKTILSLQS